MKNLPALRTGLVVAKNVVLLPARIIRKPKNVEQATNSEARSCCSTGLSQTKRRQMMLLVSIISLFASFPMQSELMSISSVIAIWWFIQPTAEEEYAAHREELKKHQERVYHEEAAKQKAKADAELYKEAYVTPKQA